MIKTSIIIPTAFDGLESRLKPCLESVRKFTDLTETEIIIVKNGCTWNGEIEDVKIVSFDDAIGYPAAINAGIKASQGEFVVLLNDDTILLEQLKNQWIDILKAPFSDEKMAISGPWMNWCPHAEHDFLIFFCVMIRQSVLDVIGMLDAEAFGVGYGEDADLCCKAKAAGFKISQVPIPNKLEYNGQMALGQFPIYHAGNKTFANWPGGEELLRKNRAILHERYGTNIGKAHDLDGWISDAELRWLAQAARKASVVIEIGSWHGKSSRAIADNLPPSGRLYCVDTWAGSKVEQDSNHASARGMNGDHAFDQYARNLWDHVESGKVVPLRMHGTHAAKLLVDMGIKADLIFIDGGHSKGETKADIQSFIRLRKEGGIICGHDYLSGLWPDVAAEVLEVFGTNVGHANDTTIWYTDGQPIKHIEWIQFSEPNPHCPKCGDLLLTKEGSDMGYCTSCTFGHRPRIYDCFTFNNELDILELRFKELFHVVDRFVIVEAAKTHSGRPKELVFEKNLGRFQEYLSKVTYIVADDLPEPEGTVTDKSWARERHQRDAIMRGLTQCRDTDIILISDVDELPSPSAIRSYNGCDDIRSFEMDLFYYNLETKAKEKWREAKILPYWLLKEVSPCGARYNSSEPIGNGGRHLSYFGGIQSIIQKIENTAHQEYATDYFKDPERIRKAIEDKRDLFDRDYVKFE